MSEIAPVVLVVDDWWCTHDAALPTLYEFPFWLYTGNSFAYALDALRSSTLDRGWRRILLGVGMRQRSNPAGYWDYETGQAWTFNQPVPDGVSPASGMREPLTAPDTGRSEAGGVRHAPTKESAPPVYISTN